MLIRMPSNGKTIGKSQLIDIILLFFTFIFRKLLLIHDRWTNTEKKKSPLHGWSEWTNESRVVVRRKEAEEREKGRCTTATTAEQRKYNKFMSIHQNHIRPLFYQSIIWIWVNICRIGRMKRNGVLVHTIARKYISERKQKRIRPTQWHSGSS